MKTKLAWDWDLFPKSDQIKKYMINIISSIKDVLIALIDSQRVAPFISGLASITLFKYVINSGLSGGEYYMAMGVVLIVFLSSIIVYFYLSKIEKDKDTAMLDMTKRIIEAVYKHFGVAMANKNATETAKIMNPIMQTIVDLTKEFQKLADKGYKR